MFVYRQLEKYTDTQEKTFQNIRNLKNTGLGYRKIAQRLNSDKTLTNKGNHWNGNNVYAVLKRHKEREQSIYLASQETEEVWSKMLLTFEKSRFRQVK